MKSSIYDDLANRLLRYSRNCLTERTDPDFADAVFTAAKFFHDTLFYPQVDGITPSVIDQESELIQHVSYTQEQCGYEK